MTPWQATLQMLQTFPKQRSITPAKFKAATPDDVIKWCKNHPSAKTIYAVMGGMGLSKSTAQRLMNLLCDEGRLLIDKDSHPKHYLYRLREPD